MGTDHAIVVGGSMAGLLAARALADAYPRVTVLDRDDLSPGRAPRRGVPQGRHIHALLARGQQVLEELFPGLTDELVGQGAPTGDVLGDARLLFGGHRFARGPSGLLALSASRPLIESCVRERVRALPPVQIRSGADVVGLQPSADGRRVTGIVLAAPGASRASDTTLDADLVVDATGRGSRAPSWLTALGFDPPVEDRLRIDVGYATRRYRLSPDALDGDMACIHGPAPGRTRGGALVRLEDDVWMATLFGVAGDHPPREPEAFDAFAASLLFPDIHDALRAGEPIDQPVGFRFPADVRRRYERMERHPEGFLVLGDAVCSLNPIYGQGMSVAALQALAVRRHLRDGPSPSWGAVIRDVSHVVDGPWQLTAGADLTLPGVDGARGARDRMAGRYIEWVQAAAAQDRDVARVFMRVTGLVDRPEALMHPRIASRVVKSRLVRRWRG